MSKKKKPKPAAPAESSVSIFFTIGWSLCVLATLLLSVAALLGWLLLRGRPDGDTSLAFVGVLHFASIVTGLVSLVLLPVMFKVRRDAPPTSLVVLGVVVALLPLLAAMR